MKDEFRLTLLKDIDTFRMKAQFYTTHHLFEAASLANKLAANIELALTTLPRDDDPEIA